tara:strand:- start:303 stop:434 length:132 start_codon:yes stop_codon:yes gene_type:complete
MSEEDEEIQWLKDQAAYLEQKKRYNIWFTAIIENMKNIGDEEE